MPTAYQIIQKMKAYQQKLNTVLKTPASKISTTQPTSTTKTTSTITTSPTTPTIETSPKPTEKVDETPTAYPIIQKMEAFQQKLKERDIKGAFTVLATPTSIISITQPTSTTKTTSTIATDTSGMKMVQLKQGESYIGGQIIPPLSQPPIMPLGTVETKISTTINWNPLDWIKKGIIQTNIERNVVKPGEISLSAYQDILKSKIYDIERQEMIASSYPSDATLLVDGKPTTLESYLGTLSAAKKQIQEEITRTEGFDPTTTVSKVEGGYQYNFPYAGAETYSEAKAFIKKDPITAHIVSFFSPENPFLLGSTYYYLTGNPMKAEQKIIESMYARRESTKNIFMTSEGEIKPASVGLYADFLKASYVDNPAVQVVATYGAGSLIGKGLGAVTGYAVQSGSQIAATASKALSTGVAVIGVGLGGKAAYDVYEVSKTDPGKAFGQGVILGTSIIVGYAGFKSGYASGYRWGAEKGFIKYLETEYAKGNIESNIYNAAKDVYESGKYVTKYGNEFVQKPMPEFSDVASVKQQPGFRKYMWEKTSASNSELFGGTVGGKPQGTHDIDVFMRAKTKIYSEYASKVLTDKDISSFADVKIPQRPGQIVSEIGVIKKPPFTVDVGGKKFVTMRGSEQFERLWFSSLRPAQSGQLTVADKLVWGETTPGGIGRLKDMPETYRLALKMFEGTKITPETQFQLTKLEAGLKTLYESGARNPLISSVERYENIYSSIGLQERIYNIKTRFWKAVTPEYKLKADISNLLSIHDVSITSGEGYLPPSPSSAIIPSSYYVGGLSVGSLAVNVGSVLKPSVKVSDVSMLPKSVSTSLKSSVKVSDVSMLPKSVSTSLKSFISNVVDSKAYSPSSEYYPSTSISPSISPGISPSYYSPEYSPSINISPSISHGYYSPKYSPSSSITPSLSLPRLFGSGGDRSFGFTRYGKRKRYREAKIIDPFKEMRRQMKEAMKIGF